jgi:poly(3-hydroxybutyrate) depolymerase
MIIPYNIIIPKLNIPIFIFHGTGDTTMYYNGANYVNSNAFSKPSLWRIIDPTVDPESTVIATNTYTANIPLFINSIITHNHMTTYYSDSNSNYNWSSYRNNTGTVLNFISLNDQGHCWSGHTSRNASSVLPSNFYMDSTYLLIKFFKLLQGDYKETVNVIPPNLLTYNNTNIV